MSTRGRNAQNVNEFIIIPTREPERGVKWRPGPPNFQNDKNKCVFTNAQSRFASVVPDAVIVAGTSVPTMVHLMESLYLCSCGSNARGEVRALEGSGVSSKDPSRV